MKALSTILMTASLVLLPLLAGAQGIGHISTDNNSSADQSYESGLTTFEFQSWATFTSPVLDGRSASFTHRMAWYGGLLTEGGSPIAVIGGSQQYSVAYELHFTVFDPGAAGYTLQLQSQLAGVLYAREDDASGAEVRLDTFSVALDDRGGPAGSLVDLPALATTRHSVQGGTTPAAGLHPVNDEGRAFVGEYVGTRNFVLAVAGGPHLMEGFSSGGQSQGHLQFGRAPALMGLQDGLYTGPAGRSLNDLGHFLSVSVEYASTAVVPEPGSWALLSLGLGVLLQVRRRQTRATQTRGCGQASEGRPHTHSAAPCAALNRTESP